MTPHNAFLLLITEIISVIILAVLAENSRRGSQIAITLIVILWVMFFVTPGHAEKISAILKKVTPQA